MLPVQLMSLERDSKVAEFGMQLVVLMAYWIMHYPMTKQVYPEKKVVELPF